MQLKHEFIKTCNQLGLQDGELALAEVIWQKAERAAWGLPNQVPCLLDNKEQTFKLSIDMIEPETCMKQELTQADIQMLTKLLADMIQEHQYHIEFDKHTIQAAWLLCDLDEPESKEAFDALNYYKQRTEKHKQKRNKLAAIQYKLKKLQSLLGN